MQIDTGTLIVAIATFIGVIISPVISALLTARESRNNRKDNRRKEWREFLLNRMNELVRLHGVLHPETGGEGYYSLSSVRSQAISIMLSVNDDTLHKIADEMPKAEHTDEIYEEIDETISRAVSRLGVLIADTMRKE